MSRKIKELQKLIKPNLKIDEKIISYESENLLSSGENYGSVMLQIQVKILNDKNQEKILHCVGKTVPPSEILWKLFNTKVTFKKEIAVYKTIVPALNDFGKEKGIDCLVDFIAECLGARISLDPRSDEVDEDAVLLLENLKMQGYVLGERFCGFDEECSKFLLQDLAVLHASARSYMLAEPEEFKEKLRPYLNKDYIFELDDKLTDELIKSSQDAVVKNPKCLQYLSKIDEAVRKMKDYHKHPPKCNEIFATLIHNDYWVNNTLLKFENGRLVRNKIVDFQVIEYSSLAHDVIFFIYSSVHLPVLENKTDELFRFYYEKFIETLAKLKCDISPYTFGVMMEEFATVANTAEFFHLLYMLPPIYTLKEKAKELSEFKLSDIIKDENSLHENYYKRMQLVVLDFVKRGWM